MSGNRPSGRMVAAGIAGAAAAAAAILGISGPLIDRSEGDSHVGYKDPVGISTWGRGHTGPEVKVGQAITQAQSDAYFDADQRKVIAANGACTKVAMPVESFAAFTSFSFNLGSGAHTMQLQNELPKLSESVTITGPGSGLLNIDGTNSGTNATFWNYQGNRVANISGMTVSNSSSSAFLN